MWKKQVSQGFNLVLLHLAWVCLGSRAVTRLEWDDSSSCRSSLSRAWPGLMADVTREVWMGFFGFVFLKFFYLFFFNLLFPQTLLFCSLLKEKSFKLPNSKNQTPSTPSPKLHVAFLMISYVCVIIQGNISKLHFWKGLTGTVLIFPVVYKLLESNPAIQRQLCFH